MEKRLCLSELVTVTNGAPNDAPQYISTAFIRGHHAIDDEKGARSNVIGYDPQARGLQICGSRDIRGGANQGLEQVDVVVAVDPLHHGRDALEPHAGIDRGLGQGHEHAIG